MNIIAASAQTGPQDFGAAYRIALAHDNRSSIGAKPFV
jgi:hypothetical protein